MLRYDRARFFAFGVLPALNCLGLLIYGLGLATHGTGGAGRSLPVLIVLVAVNLLFASFAAVKRGRDLGWVAWMTVLAFWVSTSLGPVLIIMLAYLVFAKTKPAADALGPPATPATLITWYWCFMNLVWPWITLAVLAEVL